WRLRSRFRAVGTGLSWQQEARSVERGRIIIDIIAASTTLLLVALTILTIAIVANLLQGGQLPVPDNRAPVSVSMPALEEILRLKLPDPALQRERHEEIIQALKDVRRPTVEAKPEKSSVDLTPVGYATFGIGGILFLVLSAQLYGLWRVSQIKTFKGIA